MKSLTPDETLLGLLAGRVQHGYQLLDCFADTGQLGRVWHLSTSQLYAVLKRLVVEELLIGHQVEVVDAPPRIEYSITDAGNARLEAWLHEHQPSPSIRCVRVEFLSRLYIARLLNVPTIDIVRRQKSACYRRLAELQDELEDAQPGMDYLALELHIAQLQAVLGWIDRCELTPK